MKHNNALSVAKLPLDYLLNQFPIKKNTGISSTLVGYLEYSESSAQNRIFRRI